MHICPLLAFVLSEVW